MVNVELFVTLYMIFVFIGGLGSLALGAAKYGKQKEERYGIRDILWGLGFLGLFLAVVLL